MFVKICGITQPQQAEQISRYGATHIGVVFFEKSPRHISIDQIKLIKESVCSNTKLVAVTVNPSIKDVEDLLKIVDVIQFHGNESIEFIKQFPENKIIKAFRLRSKDEFIDIKKFLDEGYTVLVDSFSKNAYGGTGKQIDRSLLRELKKITDKFILSGGLSEKNVGEIIEDIKPYGVDASSKLEISPGIKDLEKVKKFIKIAKDKLGDNI